MGLCESLHHDKTISKENYKERKQFEKVDPNDQTLDYKNVDPEESGLRPSIFNKSAKKSSIFQNNKTNNKPELEKYDRSVFNSGKMSNEANNTTSVFSSGVSEEEIIVRGEINKEAKNKDKDFMNESFKNLIKNNGGIVIENSEMVNNNNESRKQSSLFDSGKENISEIHSNENIPIQSNGIKVGNNLKKNPSFGLSSIKNDNNTEYTQKGIISGKYDIHGHLIPNNERIQINGGNDKEKKNESNNLIGLNNNNMQLSSTIRGSSRINVSLHESTPKIDSFLNVPKNDQPPPDLDELSENILRNSMPPEN